MLFTLSGMNGLSTKISKNGEYVIMSFRECNTVYISISKKKEFIFSSNLV